ncbi:hypothetical protein [Neomoorella mulderi]|uniref:hypothetical protein n=1 Tax=Neomoorella mulderi TaxID=202604 RepID=UPI000781DE02|nr:hypothetical protein [Moorella mulderi]
MTLYLIISTGNPTLAANCSRVSFSSGSSSQVINSTVNGNLPGYFKDQTLNPAKGEFVNVNNHLLRQAIWVIGFIFFY